MSESSRRIDWLDYAKGVGIASVAYFHVLVGLQAARFDISSLLQWTRFVADSAQMPLFFFLAGLYAETSLERRTSASFIIQKLRRLMYPCFVWSLISGGVQITLSGYVNSSISFSDLLSIWYRPLPGQHFWFLYTLFLMFLIFLLGFKILRKNYLPLISTAALVFYFYHFGSGERIVQKLFANMPFFVLGIIFTRYSLDRFVPQATGKGIMAASAVFLFCAFLAWYTVSYPLTLVRLALALMGIAVAVLAAKYLAKGHKIGILKTLGFYSLEIFLAHGLFLAAMRIVMHKGFGFTKAWLHIPVGVAAALFLPIIVYKVVIRCRLPYLFELPETLIPSRRPKQGIRIPTA